MLSRQNRIGTPGAFQHHKTIVKLIFIIGLKIFPGYFQPLPSLPFGKEGVAADLCVDLGEIEAPGATEEQAIDFRAARDHDFVLPPAVGKDRFRAGQDRAARRPIAPVPREDDIFPARQRTAYALVGLAAHDDGLACCDLSKAPQVSREAPGQPGPGANHPLAIQRRDHGDPHAQTATGALIFG